VFNVKLHWLLEPFKLQWVTIVGKSGAFCLVVDWFNSFFNALDDGACKT